MHQFIVLSLAIQLRSRESPHHSCLGIWSCPEKAQDCMPGYYTNLYSLAKLQGASPASFLSRNHTYPAENRTSDGWQTQRAMEEKEQMMDDDRGGRCQQAKQFIAGPRCCCDSSCWDAKYRVGCSSFPRPKMIKIYFSTFCCMVR